jgi:hypothetical protein
MNRNRTFLVLEAEAVISAGMCKYGEIGVGRVKGPRKCDLAVDTSTDAVSVRKTSAKNGAETLTEHVLA